jgi:hypothetical protein
MFIFLPTSSPSSPQTAQAALPRRTPAEHNPLLFPVLLQELSEREGKGDPGGGRPQMIGLWCMGCRAVDESCGSAKWKARAIIIVWEVRACR